MSLLDLCQWLDSTRFNAALRQSNWAFPTLDTIHTLGIVLVAGTIVLVDLRLLGLGLRSVPVAQLVARIVPATLAGFGLMFVTGGLLFSSEAVKMYHSPAFRIKMLLLALAGLNALIFHRTIYRDVAHWDPALSAPARARLAACCPCSFGSVSSRRGALSLTRLATISDDRKIACGQLFVPGVSVDAIFGGGPDHSPLGCADRATRNHSPHRAGTSAGNHSDGRSQPARARHRQASGFPHRSGIEQLDPGRSRHHARKRPLDSLFGGREVLPDPSILDKNGAARDRPGFSFHRAPKSRTGGAACAACQSTSGGRRVARALVWCGAGWQRNRDFSPA